MRQQPAYRQIGIVGTGRVASAMAMALRGHSAGRLMLWGRNVEHARTVVAAIDGVRVATTLEALAAACDLVLIAVSDDALPDVVVTLSSCRPGGSDALACHLSGRSGAAILAPLRECGMLTAAVHPAMTFTGNPVQEMARMAGARFVITSQDEQASAAADRLVALLGGVGEHVGESHRALYHAALCHAANHLVTLLAGANDALRTAGIGEPHALLGPLVRAALENSLDRGFSALSGPLLRGDEATIRDHLAAMAADCPSLLPSYRAMAQATLDQLSGAGLGVAPGLERLLD